MALRHSLLALSVIGASAAAVQPVEAQRSGFIIGIGAGPGYVSWTQSSFGFTSERQSKTGVATDFKLGGVIGESFQLYYMNKVVFFGSESAAVDLVATGMSGIGFTYPLPSNPDFYVNGGIGIHVWAELDSDAGSSESTSGLGLLAGVGYHLSELWMLDFDVMYGKPGDDMLSRNVLGAKLTINILSR